MEPKGKQRFSGRLKITIVLALLAALLALAQLYCPSPGCALTRDARALNRLKNRTVMPLDLDFDARATLSALLQPGDDRARWSEARAASIDGYVVAIGEGSYESANCYAVWRRDTHIDLALKPEAPSTKRVIVEVTPATREMAAARGADWSTQALEKSLLGKLCHVEGWLLFDSLHAGESENTAPGRANNWRGSAWEIHPVTSIEVLR